MSSHITCVVPSSDGYVRPTAKTTRPHGTRQARSRGTVRGVTALARCTHTAARAAHSMGRAACWRGLATTTSRSTAAA
eukprot:4080365-Prymnesium_polylepis.1